ncbi:MAG: hypothetical protein HGA35_00360 [Erysipelotrichaceae bacterium]|nr:hypothetical protein [Erysipelotrichaceae bacterium]
MQYIFNLFPTTSVVPLDETDEERYKRIKLMIKTLEPLLMKFYIKPKTITKITRKYKKRQLTMYNLWMLIPIATLDEHLSYI